MKEWYTAWVALLSALLFASAVACLAYSHFRRGACATLGPRSVWGPVGWGLLVAGLMLGVVLAVLVVEPVNTVPLR